MLKKIAVMVLALILSLSLAAPAFAAGSGDLPIGLMLYDFEAADFEADGAGLYVGVLELTAYRLGYQWNVKQVSVTHDAGEVEYLEYTEFAEAPSWTPYYISTQKVAIRQTSEEQKVVFTCSGPTAKNVPTAVTVTVPALAMPVLTGVNAVSADLPDLARETAEDSPGHFTVTAATDAPVVRMRPGFDISAVPAQAALTVRVYAAGSSEPEETVALSDLGGGRYEAAKPLLLLAPGANGAALRYELYCENSLFGSFTVSFEPEETVELGALIGSIKIGGLWPTPGLTPESLVPVNVDPRFVIEELIWHPALPAGGVFAEGTAYTAEITVKAGEGYLFDGGSGALNIISGGLLNNIDVGGNGVSVKLKSLYDYNHIPNFERFSLQIVFPADIGSAS